MKELVRIKVRGGQRLPIGHWEGDTFTAATRTLRDHLFRGGAATTEMAVERGCAAWGLDAAAMDGLADRGVRFVVIPTTDGPTYRARMEDIQGDKAYLVDFSGHRPQYMLKLSYWTPFFKEYAV